MFVDLHTAARLNSGKDQLTDNLIIRVEGGEDLSVSFSVGFLITTQLLMILVHSLQVTYCIAY